MIRRWCVLVTLLGGCSINLELGDLGIIACSEDAQCPGGGFCDVQVGLCRSTESSSVVTLQAPDRSVTIYSERVMLEWGPVAAEDLQLIIARDSRLSDVVAGFPRSVDGQTFGFLPPTDGTYFWTLLADGRLNAIRSFTRVFEALHVYCADDPCPAAGNGLADSPLVSPRSALGLAEAFGISRLRIAARNSGRAYDEALLVPPGVAIEGGYSPDFSERDVALYETILGPQFASALRLEEADGVEISGLRLATADGVSTAIRIEDCSNVRLHDLILAARGAERVEAIRVDDSSVFLDRVDISVVSDADRLVATGLYAEGSVVEIIESDFDVRSEGGTRGYGAFITNGSTVTVRDTEFRASNDGGAGRITALRVARSAVHIEDSQFTGAQDAIDLSDAGGTVRGNHIDLFGGDFLRGLNADYDAEKVLQDFDVEFATLRVENNLVRINTTSTADNAVSYGIQLRDCRPSAFVVHNTVVVYGSGEHDRYALLMNALSVSDQDTKVVHAVNNIFVAVGGDENTAIIKEANEYNDPETLLNNVLITEGSPAYADEAVDSFRVDLDEAGIAALDGTPVPQALCPDGCSPSRVVGNRVIEVTDWRVAFVDAEGSDLSTALMPAMGASAELLRTNGATAPATCGTVDDPVDCELPSVDATGTPFGEPRAVGALQSSR